MSGSAIAEDFLANPGKYLGGMVVCRTRCEPCMFGEHPGRKHSWANDEDIRWALGQGHADPSKELCGCYCQRTYRPAPPQPRQLIHKGRKP